MDETYLLQVLSMFFFSAWKTYIGPLIAVAAGFSFLEMLAFNMLPALCSATASLYVTDLWLTQRQTNVKGFNKNLRRALKIWRHHGQVIALLLAPILIGVPSYAFIARRLKENRINIMLELVVATFFWCTLIYWAGIKGLLLAEKVI